MSVATALRMSVMIEPGPMAFMVRLRTAAGESPLALRITFMSWLPLVRRKWTHAAADSAVAAARAAETAVC